MSENDVTTLRETVEALRREVEALRGSGSATNQRANEIEAALLDAGCSADVIGAARALFSEVAKQAPDGTWAVGSLMMSSLPKVAARFLDERPHLRGRATDPNDIANRPGYPKDAHGKPIAFQDLTDDQLFELGGADPNVHKPELWNVRESDFAHAPIESLESDRREAEEIAAAKKAAASGKPVSEMTQDELFAAAGAGWRNEADE